MTEELQLRVYGDPSAPTVVYLPGLHGDWTLVTSFRTAMQEHVRFVEVTYPRTLTWSIDDYAKAIDAALIERSITHGWVVGESFGSQIAWPFLKERNPGFRMDGVILAGGFVKHPLPWGPSALRWIGKHTGRRTYAIELKIYSWYSKFRHRHAPETGASIDEFCARRTHLDRQAMHARLCLLDTFDPREAVCGAKIPIYYLAGSIDPLVPWYWVRWWLWRNCPSYRGGKTYWFADHNVLATVPQKSAQQVLEWMQLEAKKSGV